MDIAAMTSRIEQYKKDEEAKQLAKTQKENNEYQQLMDALTSKAIRKEIEDILNLINMAIDADIPMQLFQANGVSHNLGYIKNEQKKAAYLGFIMGGFRGDIHFLINEFEVTGMTDANSVRNYKPTKPVAKHMRDFLDKYPGFKAEVYQYLDSVCPKQP